jgi:hypothetical protein
MIVRRVIAVAALCAAAFVAAPAAEAESAMPGCAFETHRTDPADLTIDRGRWSYTYQVTWCSDGTTILDVDTAVEYRDSPACPWGGRKDKDDSPVPGSAARSLFDMSEFSCHTADGILTQAENPWAIVTIYPDGTYHVETLAVN